MIQNRVSIANDVPTLTTQAKAEPKHHKVAQPLKATGRPSHPNQHTLLTRRCLPWKTRANQSDHRGRLLQQPSQWSVGPGTWGKQTNTKERPSDSRDDSTSTHQSSYAPWKAWHQLLPLRWWQMWSSTVLPAPSWPIANYSPLTCKSNVLSRVTFTCGEGVWHGLNNQFKTQNTFGPLGLKWLEFANVKRSNKTSSYHVWSIIKWYNVAFQSKNL